MTDIPVQDASFGVFPFDFGHARETANLCVTIGQSLGLTGDDLLICRAVGYFHDLGRNVEPETDRRTGMLTHRKAASGQLVRQGHAASVDGSPSSAGPGKVSSWKEIVPQHAIDSADLAGDALLRNAHFVDNNLVARVQRIIGQHSIHKPPPADPVARCLYDADILEAARFEPMYGEKHRDMFERFIHGRYSRLTTEFCKDPRIQAQWRKTRGTPAKPGAAFGNDARVVDKHGNRMTAAEMAERHGKTLER